MELEQDQERCLKSLVWATERLNGNADLAQLSKIAELIIQAMTGPWRSFHTPEHIFEVGESGDAIEVLAALFHDLVYVQVDQGISINISRYIAPFVKGGAQQLMVRDQAELPPDPMFDLVMAVFGFSAGEPLPTAGGQNEFLSAVIVVKALESLLAPDVLAETAACIEATIPFRLKVDGMRPSDRLYNRLIATNATFNFGWSDTKIVEVVKRAVRLANRDVENFASPNSAYFLSNTWNLMPETNHHLKANFYTVQEYRMSLQKMEGFMNFLKPEIIFQRFQDEPTDEMYQGMLEWTWTNLEVAKLYLGTKLVSIAIIEALSFRIGHDIPISTMMGELPSKAHSAAQLELPNLHSPHTPETVIEQEVLRLLEEGRSLDSSYDVKNSPTATFVVKSVGFAEVKILVGHAKDFFAGKISAEAFLAHCDPTVIRTVTQGVIELFERRKAALAQPSQVVA